MKLPKYLYIEPQAGMPGAGIVLSTREPFPYALVWKFKHSEEDKMGALLAKKADGETYRIPGYRIVLAYQYRLSWNYTGPLDETQVYNILKEMGEYYYTEKLEGKDKLNFLYGNRS